MPCHVRQRPAVQQSGASQRRSRRALRVDVWAADRTPEEVEAARRNECFVLATQWEDLGPEERKVALRKERFIAASRLFTIDNVMCGFRAPKVGT